MATNTCSKPPIKSFNVADILNSQKSSSDNLPINSISEECSDRGSGLHTLQDKVRNDTSIEISTRSDTSLEKQKNELSSFMTCCRQWTWTQSHSLPSVCESHGSLVRFL